MKKLLLTSCVFLLLSNISMAQQVKQGREVKKNPLALKTNTEKIQAKKEFKAQFKSGKPTPAPELTLPVRIKDQ